MLNIVDYIDSDDESVPKSSSVSPRKNVSKTNEIQNQAQAITGLQPPSSVSWQECYDESSGYTYYWNMHNGEVTWDEPDELKQHKQELEKYYQLVEANRRGLAVAAAAVLLKQKQKQQQQLRDKDKLPPDKILKEEKDAESEEDERIEMITSYGNDTLSDSESESEKAKVPPLAKKSKYSNENQDTKKTKKNVKSSDVIFGPELPAMNYNLSLPTNVIPENKVQILDTIEDNELEDNALTKIMNEASHSDSEGSVNEDDTKTDEDIIAELKQKALLLKKLGGEMPAELKLILDADESNGVSEESNAIQLLSSYGNESDNEESVKLEGTSKEASPLHKVSTKSTATTVRKFKKLKLSARGKALIEASITTQRARAAKLELPPESADDVEKTKAGLGYLPSESDSAASTFKKTEISFVKESSNNVEEEKDRKKEKEVTTNNIDGCNIDAFSSVLKSKLSYLCTQEKKEASTLQKIRIQLETLYTAWEKNALSEKYLSSICAEVSQRLKKLEQEKLPPGWVAMWDLAQSRYYYFSEKENLKQYHFPANTSLSDGEEDMDLCTTPPHSPSMNHTNAGNYSTPASSEATDSKDYVVPPPIPGIEDYSSESPPPLPPPPSSPPPLPPPPPPSHSPPPKPPPPPSYSPKPPPLPPGYNPKHSAHFNPKPPAPSLNTTPPPPNYPTPPPPNYTPTNPPPPPDYNPRPPPPPHYSPVPPPPSYSPVPPPNYNPTPPNPDYNPTPSSAGYKVETPPPPSYNMEAPPPPSISYVSPPSPVPPPASTQVNKLLSELDSFYSDIASMTSPPPAAQYSKPPSSSIPHTEPCPSPPPPCASSAAVPAKKKKKSTKVAPVLSMKKKNVSSLVAKWQQVQQDL